MNIKRGHLYLADLSPRFGTEPGKIRPVLVIQTDLMNGEHPSTLVCPLTTKIREEVDILRVHLRKHEAGLDEPSDIIIDQIRAIDNSRLKKEIGKISPARLETVGQKIQIVLDLIR